MISKIPHDPSVMLGGIVNPELIAGLVEISALQAAIDAKSAQLEDAIQLKEKLKMINEELIISGLGADDLKPIETAITLASSSITTVATEYAKISAANMAKIAELQATRPAVSLALESPVDYDRSALRTLPLAVDSLRLEARYFSFADGTDTSTQMTAIRGMLSSTFEQSGLSANRKASTDAMTAATGQIHSQQRSHNIEGVLLIAAGCTHRNAMLWAPLVVNAEKAIDAWNALRPGGIAINTADRRSLQELLMRNQKAATDEPAINIVSGATFGSSFIGMVHVLKQPVTRSPAKTYELAARLKPQMDVGAWLGSAAGSMGSDPGTINQVRSLLFSQTISAHCSMVVVGAIPSLQPTEGALGATSGASTGVTDGHQIFDLNTLMGAFSQYVNQVTRGAAGVPLSYFLKPLTAGSLAKLWLETHPEGASNEAPARLSTQAPSGEATGADPARSPGSSEPSATEVEARTKAETPAPATASSAPTPTKSASEVPKDVQEQWGAATKEIVSRFNEMSQKLDTMSPPLPTKDDIKKVLASYGQLLSDPLQTVEQARKLAQFIKNDELVSEIENSSRVEPKVQIRSRLVPILAKITGNVAPPPASDNAATNNDSPASAAESRSSAPVDANAEASTENPASAAESPSSAPDEANAKPSTENPASAAESTPPAREAGANEIPKDVQEQWGAAIREIIARFGEMSQKLDAMSPPLPTKDDIKKVLASFGQLLSEPLQTIEQAHKLAQFIENDKLISEIENSSLVEPKVQIRSRFFPILATITGNVAPPQTSDNPATNDEKPARAAESTAPAPASKASEIPQKIQKQWGAATKEIVARFGEMSQKLDEMSPALPTKDDIKKVLASFGQLLSEPLRTVEQALKLAQFIENDELISEIENSSLVEPKVQIRSRLVPILATITGNVAPPQTSDNPATNDEQPARAAESTAPAPAPKASEIPQKIQKQWGAATKEIVARFGEMSQKLDEVSPALPTKDDIKKVLASFGQLLSEPLRTVERARKLAQFIENDELISEIENSSLVEPKVQIRSGLVPILATITGNVAQAPTSDNPATNSNTPARAAESTAPAPASKVSEIPQKIQKQWGAATKEIVARFGEMSQKLDEMSPALPTKDDIKKVLASFGQLLSEPLRTVEQALKLAQFIENDELISEIENSSLVEPKVQIRSNLSPILSRSF